MFLVQKFYLKFFEEVTIDAVFKNNIDPTGVVKIAIKSAYIFVPDMRLNLNFSPYLMLQTCFTNFSFEQNFQGWINFI